MVEQRTSVESENVDFCFLGAGNSCALGQFESSRMKFVLFARFDKKDVAVKNLCCC